MFFDEYHPEGDDSLVPTHLRTSFFNSCDESTAFGVDMSRLLRYAPSDRIHTEDYQKNISGFFRKEPCLYTSPELPVRWIHICRHETGNEDEQLSQETGHAGHFWGWRWSQTSTKVYRRMLNCRRKWSTVTILCFRLMDFRSANEKRLSFMLVFRNAQMWDLNFSNLDLFFYLLHAIKYTYLY